MARFVLVHGSMHGAWCWEHVVPLLEAMGHEVEAIDLPAQGKDMTPPETVTAEDCTASVVAALDRAGEPAILVGHSLGGTVIAHAAEETPARVRGLVFVTAILIGDGATMIGACPEIIAAHAEAHARHPGDPGAAAAELLYGHTPPERATAAIARLRPQPPQVMVAPMRLSDERFGRVRRAYVECADDAIVSLAVQRRMQAALPCDPVVTMAGDHSPFLSAPKTLARHLDTIARAWA